jgi:hypothetical protein
MKKFLLILLLLSLMPTEAKAQADVRVDCATQTGQWVACTSPGLGNAGYPTGSTPLAGAFSGANTTTSAATITAPAGKTPYTCYIEANGLGATALGTVQANLTQIGPVGGTTWSFEYTYVAGATLVNVALIHTFNPCVSGGPVGGTMTFNVPGAAGNTLTNLNIQGYAQ